MRVGKSTPFDQSAGGSNFTGAAQALPVALPELTAVAGRRSKALQSHDSSGGEGFRATTYPQEVTRIMAFVRVFALYENPASLIYNILIYTDQDNNLT